ncbi:Ig-like domain-containing protein [Curtobacterium flaccumfaciens]|nr:Ig-like domain-containing protein [Curtobacterium flaccumfaciens]
METNARYTQPADIDWTWDAAGWFWDKVEYYAYTTMVKVIAPVGSSCRDADAQFSYADGAIQYAGQSVGRSSKDVFGPGKHWSWCETRDKNSCGIVQNANWYSTNSGFFGGVTPTPLDGDFEAIKPFSADWTFQDERDEKSVISGKGRPDASISVVDADAREVASTSTDAEGNYSVEIDAPNKGGEYALTVKQTDADGAELNRAVSLDYGSAVKIESPEDQSEQDESPITVEGTGQKGSSVTVSVNGTTSNAVTVKDNGTWSKAVSLSRGENVIEVTQKSKGANTTTQTVTVNPGEDGAEFPTPDARIVFPEENGRRAVANGTGAAGASIEVFDGEKKVGSATVNSNGSWSSELVAVGNGVHTLTIKQTLGEKNNQGTVDADYGTELTVTAPATVKDTTAVTLTGTGTPGAKIEFRDNTNQVRSTTVDANSAWSLTGNFRPDTTEVTVASLSKGALMVRKQATIDVQMTTRALTVTSPTRDDADNDRITDGTVQFTGTATPFSTVQFATWPDGLGREVFTTYADENGNWSASGWLAKSYYKLLGRAVRDRWGHHPVQHVPVLHGRVPGTERRGPHAG